MSGGRKDAGRIIATAIVAIVVLGTLLVLRPDRWLSPAVESEAPSSTPAFGPTVPPVSDTAWRRLSIAPLTEGPAGAESLVAWSGGYLAMGPTVDGRWMQGWTSIDGRAWAPLSPDVLGQAEEARAGAAFGGLVIAVRHPGGAVEARRSGDGTTWDRTTAPDLLLSGDSRLAGSPRALVAVVGGDPNHLAFSADGASWQAVVLPGLLRMDVLAVASFGGGFVALGSRSLPVIQGAIATAASQTSQPVVVAWWSGDGLTWQPATMADAVGGSFTEVHAGAGGLVAASVTGGAPSFRTVWQSADGMTWSVSAADPLGVIGEGEGQGSAIGTFTGDGQRLLVSGGAGRDKPGQVWTSFDGSAWTQLEVSGEAADASLTDTMALLLRDGVLLVGPSAAWFGVAAP